VAELVAWAHSPAAIPALAEAIDPVCGMTVAVTPGTLSTTHHAFTSGSAAPAARRRSTQNPRATARSSTAPAESEPD